MTTFTFTSPIDLLPKLKIHYVAVPSEIVTALGGIGSRLECSINNHDFYQCGMTALGGGRAYVALNKKRMKDFGVEKGMEVNVQLKPDESKYGFDMPEELQAVLEQDVQGAAKFESLTDGQKRYIIYYVSQVKSVQLRIDRALTLIGNLKTMPGKFSFRHLLGLPPKEE